MSKEMHISGSETSRNNRPAEFGHIIGVVDTLRPSLLALQNRERGSDLIPVDPKLSITNVTELFGLQKARDIFDTTSTTVKSGYDIPTQTVTETPDGWKSTVTRFETHVGTSLEKGSDVYRLFYSREGQDAEKIRLNSQEDRSKYSAELDLQGNTCTIELSYDIRLTEPRRGETMHIKSSFTSSPSGELDRVNITSGGSITFYETPKK